MAGDLISGNAGDGVNLPYTVDHDTVKGNLIGVNSSGNTALANRGFGVNVGGSGDIIGGTGNGERNIISGNTAGGVLVATGLETKIQQNFIGTSGDGKKAIGNGNSTHGAGTTAGVRVSGASETLIAGNLISGQGLTGADGVMVDGFLADNTRILSNVIGLMAGGTGDLGNLNGIVLAGHFFGTRIGDVDAGNVIGFNKLAGIKIGAESSETTIQGNTIGLDAKGHLAGNQGGGIEVLSGKDLTIGLTNYFTDEKAGNVISGNSVGIEIQGKGVTGTNVIRGNLIGTDPNGGASRGNTRAGLSINNFTGGTLDVLRNTISGNTQDGVLITNSQKVAIGGTEPQGSNLIGLPKLGTGPLPNGGDGVRVVDSTGITIGERVRRQLHLRQQR